MGFLTDEEIARLAPAESSLFRSPIPVQSVSSDEFEPAPQTGKQREFEARVKAIGAELAPGARASAAGASSRPRAAWPRRSSR